MTDMMGTTAPLAMIQGARIHRPRSADALARRAERNRLLALFGVPHGDTRNFNPEQVAYFHSQHLLPGGPEKASTQTAQSLPSQAAAEHAAGQAMSSMILSQRANPPASRRPGTGQRGASQTVNTAAATMAALQMLGL